MELRQLRYFVTLAKILNFRRAAEQLHISQPPLSVQIKLLEEELGARLFNRHPSGITLTGPGQVLLKHAYGILRAVENAREEVRLSANAQIGTMRIGMTTSAELTPFVARTISRFRQRYPSVTLHIRAMPTEDQVKAVAGGQIDLGLVRRPLGDLAEKLELTLLWSDKLFLAIHTDHPLASEEQVDIRRLADEAFLIGSRDVGMGLNYTLMHLCQEAGFQPLVIQEVYSPTVIVELVGEGLGVALVPESLQTLKIDNVRFIPLMSPLATCNLYALNRPADTNPLVADLRSGFREFAAGRSWWDDWTPTDALPKSGSLRINSRAMSRPPDETGDYVI